MATARRRKPPVQDNGLVRDQYGGYTADQVTPLEPKWLAAPVIGPWRWPVGTLVYLNGEGGTGKSQVTMHLASAVTRGQAWPDGGKSTSPPGNVLIFNGDDSVKYTIVNRLNAVNADLKRIRFLEDVREDNGLQEDHSFHLPEDLNTLFKYIAKHKIKLVIIDPANVYFRIGPGVRHRVLNRLMTEAEDLGCTIILVRHIPNYMQKSKDAADRGAGGHELGTACRAGYDVIEDKAHFAATKEERFVLRCRKNSYAKKAPARSYSIHESPAPEHHKAPFVEFEPEEVTIEELDRMLAFQAAQTPSSEAEEWLERQLNAAGEEGVPRKDLMAKAVSAGIPERTIDNVAKRLRVVKRTTGGQENGRPVRTSRWWLPTYAPSKQ